MQPLDDATSTSTHPPLFTPSRVGTILILAVSAVVYLPNIEGRFIWDDRALTGGAGIGGGDSLLHCFTRPFLGHYFRPLVSVSFYLESMFTARNASHLPNPFFYHQTNILIHVVTTGLAIGLFRSLFPRRMLPAFAGGLIFALQPAQVGAVAWIGGRTDALACLFATGFAWAVVRAATTDGASSRRAGIVGAVLFGLALLSKEQTLWLLPLVPIAFRLFDPPAGPRSHRSVFLATLPFAIAAVAFLLAWRLLIRFEVLPALNHTPPVVAGLTLWEYARLLIVPMQRDLFTINLTGYDYAWAVPGFGAVLLAVALAVRLRRSSPAVSWLIAFAVLGILPVSNLFPMSALVVAPYRAAVAGVAVAGLLGRLLAGKEDPNRINLLDVRVPAVIAVVWLYSMIASGGVMQWRSERTLFTALARYNLGSPLARGGLAAEDLVARPPRAADAAAQYEGLLDAIYRSPNWRSPEAAVRDASDPAVLDRAGEQKLRRGDSRRVIAGIFLRLGEIYRYEGDETRAKQAYSIQARIASAVSAKR